MLQVAGLDAHVALGILQCIPQPICLCIRSSTGTELHSAQLCAAEQSQNAMRGIARAESRSQASALGADSRPALPGAGMDP